MNYSNLGSRKQKNITQILKCYKDDLLFNEYWSVYESLERLGSFDFRRRSPKEKSKLRDVV